MPFHRLGPSACLLLLGALGAYAAAPPAGGAPGPAAEPARGGGAERSAAEPARAAGAEGSAAEPARAAGTERTADAGLRVRIGGPGSAVTEIPLEDYVRGAVHKEASLGGLPADAAARLAEVQAILARTYAVANRGRHAADGFDLCATTHCQVFRSAPSESADVQRVVADAAARTAGLVVVHDGGVVNALFHADCGGATSAAEAVWGGHTPPYLRGVDDPYCLTHAAPPWSVTLDESAAREALNRHPGTRVGGVLHSIEVVERDAAGRAISIRLAGERTTSVRGERFRTALMRTLGPHAVRSTRLEVHRVGGDYVLSGTGHGHGVGVCQIGARARARAGHAAADILAHYYPDTQVAPLHGSG